jgi:hypothetical protein
MQPAWPPLREALLAMGISVARKLQAFRAVFYPEIEFELLRVALTPDQVRECGT